MDLSIVALTFTRRTAGAMLDIRWTRPRRGWKIHDKYWNSHHRNMMVHEPSKCLFISFMVCDGFCILSLLEITSNSSELPWQSPGCRADLLISSIQTCPSPLSWVPVPLIAYIKYSALDLSLKTYWMRNNLKFKEFKVLFTQDLNNKPV